MYFICTEYVGDWPTNRGSCLEFYRTCTQRLKEQENGDDSGQDGDGGDSNDDNNDNDNENDNDNDSDSNSTTESPEDEEPLEGRKI